MDFQDLGRMLDRFEEMIPDGPGTFGVAYERHDWRPIWAFAKSIQVAFDDRPTFPSTQDRKAAWERFNTLRDRAGSHMRAEREVLEEKSTRHRATILNLCSGISYDPVADAIVGFGLDDATPDKVKKWGEYLGKAMKALSKRKHEMLSEHKNECFTRIQEVKESHDRFWAEYKGMKARRHNEHSERRAGMIRRLEDDLERNRERLAKSLDALSRQEAHAAELRQKVADSTSAKWLTIHESWLEDAEVKIRDIEASVERIREWLHENERRLADLK